VRKNAVLPRTIGKKVKKRRTSLGLTQEELAEKVGISRAYMGFVEQGRNVPTLETLEKIAKALKVKMAELV
jgi:transcriptional regulator with XRE-family HTH domain